MDDVVISQCVTDATNAERDCDISAWNRAMRKLYVWSHWDNPANAPKAIAISPELWNAIADSGQLEATDVRPQISGYTFRRIPIVVRGQQSPSGHATEGKYGTINSSKKDFHTGEPVFLYRATDKLAPSAIRYYAALCRGHGCAEEHCRDIDEHAAEIERWQAANPTLVKLPD